MVLGTSSHVGKSVITAALCRIFASAGYSVAPFKSQNMSLNSAATSEGLEIGRAQALQAEAAGVAASVHMNPILLKPMGDACSQVIVRGKIYGQLSATNYHQHRARELLPVIEESYRWLAARHDVIVIEGAGSPAEINLKENDIVNLRIAQMADAPCLLVGDIDRGGVFASLYGTCALLDDDERARIRGFVINKFRGDIGLLKPGITLMEDRLQKPCFGVIPFLHGLDLDQEDSVDLEEMQSGPWPAETSNGRRLRVGVVALPSLSNFTDFNALRAEPCACVHYCRKPEELADADLVILPGAKQTIDDLRWLKRHGWTQALEEVAERALLVGICGGMQMLGMKIRDPEGVETEGMEAGLGLLQIRTSMLPEKVTSPASGVVCEGPFLNSQLAGKAVSGYEIHVGQMMYLEGAQPFARLRRHSQLGDTLDDGCVSENGRVIGTYLHGLFDEDDFRHALLSAAVQIAGIAHPDTWASWKVERARSLDRIRDAVANALDLDAIFGLVELPSPTGSWH